MAVKIRLKRMGKIRAPYYRVVVADARTKRDGRAIEEIGYYHPTDEPSTIEVNSERAQYWLGVGAQPTEQVLVLLKITGDWQKHKGLPGAEGTLKVAEAKADKKAVFEAAARESMGASTAQATTPKAKKKSEAAAKADDTAAETAPAGDPATPAADQAPAEKADGPAEKADGPAEKADGPAEKADGPAEKADGPAEEADPPAAEA